MSRTVAVDLGADVGLEELLEEEREGQERASVLKKGRDLASLAASLPVGYIPLAAADLARLARLQRALAQDVEGAEGGVAGGGAGGGAGGVGEAAGADSEVAALLGVADEARAVATALSSLLAVTQPEPARYVAWLTAECVRRAPPPAHANGWLLDLLAPLSRALDRCARPPVDVPGAAAPLLALAPLLASAPASHPAAPDAIAVIVKLVEAAPRPALRALGTVLRPGTWRPLVVARGGVDALERLLLPLAEPSPGTPDTSAWAVQRAYESLYALWLLSFSPAPPVQQRLQQAKLLGAMGSLLRRGRKGKVVRLALAIWRNLAAHAEGSSAPPLDALLAAGGTRLLAQLEAKNKTEWGDEDLSEDLGALTEQLEGHVALLSTWARYELELAGGRLEWTPSHRSEAFWQANCLNFEAQDFAALRRLRALLEDARTEARTLEVACWDVGELVRVHPRGRQLAAARDLQGPVMRLLAHADEAVRQAALLALQKLLVSNWEYLAQANK